MKSRLAASNPASPSALPLPATSQKSAQTRLGTGAHVDARHSQQEARHWWALQQKWGPAALALIPSNDEAPFIVTSFNNMTNETWAHLLDALDTYRGPAIREICADLTAHLGGFMKRQISVPLYQFETLPREQDLLFSELRAHQEAMRASARQQERREQALTQSHRDQLRQLRMDNWRNRYHTSDIGDDISELADRIWPTESQRCKDDRGLVPASSNPTSTSTDGQLRQMLTDQQSSSGHLLQDLANQKATTLMPP
ncbi:hypothetical protein MMC22_002308 [Lobaria immixta]|nr:hypothetical protein [Lobaria immixta]